VGRSSKVLASLGVGEHVELLDLAAHSLRPYASRHGYDLCLEKSELDPSRPAPWSKLLLIQRLLSDYSSVVLIDADAVVMRHDVDIVDLLPNSAQFAMVAHKTPEGDEILNTGVMVIRRSRMSRRLIADAYSLEHLVHHKWWENAAVLEAMGYTTEAPVTLTKPTRYRRRLHLLPTEWNFIPGLSEGPARIRHYAGFTQEERVAGITSDLRSIGLL
jgi:hypothetical protein